MKSILVNSGLAESLINFRGPLLAALHVKGLQVHVASLNLPEGSAVRQQLQELGYVVLSVPMRRTGTNPVADAFTLWQLWRLMRRTWPSNLYRRIGQLQVAFHHKPTLGLYLGAVQI